MAMMRWVILLFCVGCGSASADVALGPVRSRSSEEVLPPHHYRLELRGETAALTLWLPSSERRMLVDLPQMSGRENRRTQIEDVRCDGAAVPPRDGWRLPTGCRVLTWSVRFREVPVEGVDPAAQLAVRDVARGWWFLPGAAAFLRPDGSSSAGTVDIQAPDDVPVFHRLTASDRLGYALPPAPASGRVFIGFGAFVERETSDGATTYRHLFDRDPSEAPSLTTAAHAQGATFLTRVTGARPASAIDVFWFGRDASLRTVSGAAGIDAIAAAYLLGEISAEAPAHARHASLLVLLHEQFHLLAGGRLPAWASESLAHYYALAALVHAGAMERAELEAFVRGAANSDTESTLLADQQAYVGGGAAAGPAYARFYTRGALFWLEVDSAIRAASQGARSLDDLLAEILGLVFVEGGAPPQRFLELLREGGVTEPESLTRPHLAWPS